MATLPLAVGYFRGGWSKLQSVDKLLLVLQLQNLEVTAFGDHVLRYDMLHSQRIGLGCMPQQYCFISVEIYITARKKWSLL